MLELFYHPVVVSVIYFAVLYFAGGQHQCQRCPHDQQLIHKARTIAGQNVQVWVSEGREVNDKLLSTMDNPPYQLPTTEAAELILIWTDSTPLP